MVFEPILSSGKNIGSMLIRKIMFSFINPILHIWHFPKQHPFLLLAKISDKLWSFFWPHKIQIHQNIEVHGSNFEHNIQSKLLSRIQLY